MANYTWFLLLTCFFHLTLYLCVCQEITLECNPEDNHKNFSSRDAYGVIYSISEEKLKSTGMDASIICSTKNFDVNMELLVYGEPPKALQLVLSNDILSQLYNSTIICSMLDIRDLSGIINRAPFFKEEIFYKNLTGAFNYNCGDRLNIKLEGVEILSKNFRGIAADQSLNRDRRSAQPQKNEDIEKNKGNCVKVGNKSQGEDRDNLGYLCVCSSGTCGRWMLNEEQELVCSLCCANHYFQIRTLNCEECGGCSTSNSSAFTKCIYDPNCKRPSTPDELSTINKKPHTSTTISTSTPGTTTPTSTPGTTTHTSTTGTTTTGTITTASTTSTTSTISETAKNDESGWKTGEIGVILLLIFVVFVGIYFAIEKFPCFKSLYTQGKVRSIVKENNTSE